MRFSDLYVKVYHEDFVRHGIVKNRVDQHFKIKKGVLPPPHKVGDNRQSPAFWWADEIDSVIDREREQYARASATG
ncbi:hypothetical protein GOD58_15065 [Sinorhizobium medicae]|nr:hypothetical protein [Sinorhizobium medicae]